MFLCIHSVNYEIWDAGEILIQLLSDNHNEYFYVIS